MGSGARARGRRIPFSVWMRATNYPRPAGLAPEGAEQNWLAHIFGLDAHNQLSASGRKEFCFKVKTTSPRGKIENKVKVNEKIWYHGNSRN
jgi:hypothetical protein